MAKQPTTQFQQEVFDLCRQIPPGQGWLDGRRHVQLLMGVVCLFF